MVIQFFGAVVVPDVSKMIIADAVISPPPSGHGGFVQSGSWILKLGTEAGPTDVFWSRNSGQVTVGSVDVDE